MEGLNSTENRQKDEKTDPVEEQLLIKPLY